VLGDHDIAPRAVALQGATDVLRPGQGIAHQRAAYRQQVVHVLGGDLDHVQHPELRVIHDHFRRCLGARRQLEDDVHAVDAARLDGLVDQLGRRDQRGGAERQRLAQPRVDLAPFSARHLGAELVLGVARHGNARDRVLADRFFHEAGRGDDPDRACRDVFAADDPARAAEMVAVAVRIDQRRHRLSRPVPEVQLVRDLEQSADHVDPGLAPQPGVHRVRRFLLGKELVALKRPHATPAVAHDHLVAQRLD
jgi:hypothetical protein